MQVMTQLHPGPAPGHSCLEVAKQLRGQLRFWPRHASRPALRGRGQGRLQPAEGRSRTWS